MTRRRGPPDVRSHGSWATGEMAADVFRAGRGGGAEDPSGFFAQAGLRARVVEHGADRWRVI